MKPAKTIFFAVLLLTVVYSATKVRGGRVSAIQEPVFPTALCVACSQPSQVSSKAFPVRQKGNIKLLEERLRTLYPKP